MWLYITIIKQTKKKKKGTHWWLDDIYIYLLQGHAI